MCESYVINHGDKILCYDLIFVDTMLKKKNPAQIPRIVTVAKGVIMKDRPFSN